MHGSLCGLIGYQESGFVIKTSTPCQACSVWPSDVLCRHVMQQVTQQILSSHQQQVLGLSTRPCTKSNFMLHQVHGMWL